MVIGDLANPHHLDTEEHQVFSQHLKELQDDVRAFLSTSRPHYLKLRMHDISLIGYEDPRLPLEETQVYPLDVFRSNLSEMKTLFLEM
jgi:hypothetical protein